MLSGSIATKNRVVRLNVYLNYAFETLDSKNIS